MKPVHLFKVILPGLVLFSASVLNSFCQVQQLWGRQFGTPNKEYVMNHLTDNDGSIFVSGTTAGSMDGVNYGKDDGFITRLDSLGNIKWKKQFGSPGKEDIQWSALDDCGNIYITGSTSGDLGGKNKGADDIFVIKYNSDGQLVWVKQFGTDSTDIGRGVFADEKGFIYLTGLTTGRLGQSSFGKCDAFVIKLDSKGNGIFTYQFGTPADDHGVSITGDKHSGIYVCGMTWGDLSEINKGFADLFSIKMSDEGKLISSHQYGTDGFDIPMVIRVDKLQNIYIGGSTSGNFEGEQAGEGDCFLMKIGRSGKPDWKRQFGTTLNDGLRSIEINDNITDNIVVSGVEHLPPAQAFVSMYDKTGNCLWKKNFEMDFKPSDSSGKSVSIDNFGNIYHTGLTRGSLFSESAGDSDFYIVKLLPESKYLNR